MKTLLLALILTASSAFAQTARLSDDSYLRKLSFHLRGVPPSPAEYQDLRNAADKDAFFKTRIQEYVKSPQGQAKMGVRLEEVFKLKTATQLPGDIPDMSSYPFTPAWNDALDDLFLRLSGENLSWDQLLTGKSYNLFRGSNQSFNDFTYISSIAPQVKPVPTPTPAPGERHKLEEPVAVSFAPDDDRVGGALTTSRFFGRYMTTEINKNRRRAAAVFNIFLCDPMSAAVKDPPATPDSGLDKAFPDTSTITEGDIQAIAKGADQHGADQACAKCHYKLDPAGQSFMMSTVTLSPLKSPGALVYKDDRTGALINQPVNGIGGLGRAITQQPQYVRCQIKRFWNWFIGEDRELSDARLEDLTKEFERVGRRTNDFVEVMVTAPEFRTRDFRTPEEVRAVNVQAVLGKCVACHDASKIPNFNQWPIGGSGVSMADWIGKISKSLDLDHDGAQRVMPPVWSGWQPQPDELKLLKDWIGDRAPDAKGQPQI